MVEIANCNLQLVQSLPKVALKAPNPKGALKREGSRRVYLGEWIDVPVYRWEELPLGSRFEGPALVDATGTTVWVDRTHAARVDDRGNLHLISC